MSNIRTRLSGIHNKPFYTPISIDSINYSDLDNITIPEEVFYDTISNYDAGDYTDHEDMIEEADQEIMEAIFMLPTVWEVKFSDFDIKLALKCNLIPFKYYDRNSDKTKHFLASGCCGMDLSPRLELYQFLQDGTMDKHSKLYGIINHGYTNDIKYFENVTYKGAIEEVKAILALNTEQAD